MAFAGRTSSKLRYSLANATKSWTFQAKNQLHCANNRQFGWCQCWNWTLLQVVQMAQPQGQGRSRKTAFCRVHDLNRICQTLDKSKWIVFVSTEKNTNDKVLVDSKSFSMKWSSDQMSRLTCVICEWFYFFQVQMAKRDWIVNAVFTFIYMRMGWYQKDENICAHVSITSNVSSYDDNEYIRCLTLPLW